MNDGDANSTIPQRESHGQSFQFLNYDCGEIISTLLVRNTSTEKLLGIAFLEETDRHLLIELWEEDRNFGALPILKDEEVIRIIKNEPMEKIASFIWQRYRDSQSGLRMLNRKRIGQTERYSSKLNLIARHAAVVLANTVGENYLFLAQKENRQTDGLDEWKASGSIPEWLDRLAKLLQLLILREFDTYPGAAKAMCDDYWRAVVSIALQELKDEGIKEITRKELKVILNRQIFENEDFDGHIKAVYFCGRAFAIKEVIQSKVNEKSIEEWDQLLRNVKQPPNDRRCKPSPFVFERERILPFGAVEEQVRMSWQNPVGSDLEILHGGIHSDLDFSLQEIYELLKEAISLWQNRKKIWQDAREKLHNPEDCFSFLRWVFNEHRRMRRHLRARYGIDMAHHHVLRKAVAPNTAKDTAHRAIVYAETMALEAASEAANFTFVWFRDELTEAGHELFEVKAKAIKEAAKASLGVLEAFPLFHLAILNRTSNPAIKAAETYFLCGIGAEVAWRRFPSFNKALSIREGNRLSGEDSYARFIEQLPEAVLNALKDRQLGELLVNGRNSFRNKVSQYFRKQDESKPSHELASSDSLEKMADGQQVKGIRRLAAEDHALVEEARGKIAKLINCSHLSPQQQAIMELKLLEGKSQNEIASQLNLPVNQVKCQQSRAFKKDSALRDYARLLLG